MNAKSATKIAQILSYQARQIDDAEWTEKYTALATASDETTYTEALKHLKALWVQVITASAPELAANGAKAVWYTGGSVLAGAIMKGSASAPIRVDLGTPSASIFHAACSFLDQEPGTWERTWQAEGRGFSSFAEYADADAAAGSVSEVLPKHFAVLNAFTAEVSRSTAWRELHKNLRNVRDIEDVSAQASAYLDGMKQLAGAWEETLLAAQDKLAELGVQVHRYPGTTIFAARITMGGRSAPLRMDFEDPTVSILTLMRDLTSSKPAHYAQRFDEWVDFMAATFDIRGEGKSLSCKLGSAQALLQAAAPDLVLNLPFAFRVVSNDRRLSAGPETLPELQVMNPGSREVEQVVFGVDRLGADSFTSELSNLWESDCLPTW